MRRKRDTQGWLDFQPSNLKLTNEYFARYQAISQILDETPELLEQVHRDLVKALNAENRRRKKECRITSEMVLRLALCQLIEGLSLRETIVRVDDSHRLRVNGFQNPLDSGSDRQVAGEFVADRAGVGQPARDGAGSGSPPAPEPGGSDSSPGEDSEAAPLPRSW